ncbi:MAG: hypothetical protein ABL986_06575 [Vicinamibacterales bacterium]
MKILVGALHAGYYRNLESVIAKLAAREHDIYLGSERHMSALGGDSVVDGLCERPNVTRGVVPRREKDGFFVSVKVRLALDYLRYLAPEYAETDALLKRSVVRTPSGIVWLAQRRPFSSQRGRRLLQGALDTIDHAMEPSPAIERFLDQQRPDVVLITPLVGLVPSSQLDLLRSAHARGIPTGVCVWSWDHLSSKAIIRDWPDRLFVWNDVQKHEAVEMHGIPEARIVVTGAQNFDRWFGRTPSRDRETFAARVGLPDAGPFVMWVCSALFPGSPSEAEFVMQWVRQIRESADPAVRNVSILIRPHPSRAKEWEGIDWARYGRTALWGGNPVDEQSRADYFDSLHHSAAVVGLNTSAFIEAGIVGRPVLAILPPEFRTNQEATLHFRYLQTVGGGLLTTSRSLSEHVDQLSQMIVEPPPEVLARQREFVKAFVRPHGLNVSATMVMTKAIEDLAQLKPAPKAPRASRAGRLGLSLLHAMERSASARRFLLNEREMESKRRRAEEEHREVSWI